jgi:malonyl-CoA/methylmalonyl-CoA synthetase
MARLLASRGLKAGDRLCVYLSNGVGIIDLFLACMKLGLIFVPINILYKERSLSINCPEPR